MFLKVSKRKSNFHKHPSVCFAGHFLTYYLPTSDIYGLLVILAYPAFVQSDQSSQVFMLLTHFMIGPAKVQSVIEHAKMLFDVENDGDRHGRRKEIW